MIMVLSIMLSTTVVLSATSEIEEEYLSDMRLVYADSYNEAKLIVYESKLEGYEVLDRNLNANSGEIGVWLVYKTSTDVNDAITDVAVMQMGGGYKAGNYQQLINNSRAEYLEMGEIYSEAIEYFATAYAKGDFLAQSAYRQLNLYRGIDDYEEEPLGDLFVKKYLSEYDLATLFVQGNKHILDNIRALLAMGVSYNEDGKHYLEKVSDSAKKMNADPDVFKKKGYNNLAEVIAFNIEAFRDMLEELAAYEAELNYEDDELTDLEIKYSEYKALAEMMRSVNYLGGKTLYEFCLNYEINRSDYSSLYPLVDALNDGQKAMTMVSRYYDVIRYSMTEVPVELIESEISKLEEIYGNASIDVYLGVDREMYEETFALTNRAYRADVYSNDNSLAAALFGDNSWLLTRSQISSGAINVGLSVWSITQASGRMPLRDSIKAAVISAEVYGTLIGEAINALMLQSVDMVAILEAFGPSRPIYNVVYDVINDVDKNALDTDATLNEMCDILLNMACCKAVKMTNESMAACKLISQSAENTDKVVVASAFDGAQIASSFASALKVGMYFSGAVISAINAITAYHRIHDHYHPKYDDIPTAMVDLVSTPDGNRHVKYNVVYEAQPQKDGGYAPADLNAFKGERWNALYYTKSAHAGRPLLAEFEFSDDDNRASDGYSVVHRFDEVICYDVNKYNFSSDSDAIFWSIEQSKYEKPGSIDAPNVVGSMFNTGSVVISGVAGAVIGVGVTVCTQSFLKKKKKKTDEDAENAA